MPRISRGCQRCRERRVKCDEERPTCRRCRARDELCVGYRDDSELLFRHETIKTVERAGGVRGVRREPAALPLGFSRGAPSGSSASPSRERSASFSSVEFPRNGSGGRSIADATTTPSETDAWSAIQSTRLDLPQTGSVEDTAVSQFMDRFVQYPCRDASAPGFLEHLPSLFQDANISGRHALRFAVVAASLADASRQNPALGAKSLECYGQALSAFAKSLGQVGKEPDDYDLMTVVVLDIFETLYLADITQSTKGSHAQGMAHILRLRGHEQFHSPRGWALFRLAHHRLQKQQLAMQLLPTDQSLSFLNWLPGGVQLDRLETNTSEISATCKRARSLMSRLQDDAQTASASEVVDLISQMHEVDRMSMSWRRGPAHAFQTIQKSDIRGDISKMSPHPIPDSIELHPDVWNAYEWNYHRTSRLILHEKLLGLLHAVSSNEDFASSAEAAMIVPLEFESTTIIQSLATKILSTVPQSLGDIDHTGCVIEPTVAGRLGRSPTSLRAIGSYLLLWPIKILMSATTKSIPNEQKRGAETVFERIREYTGMKAQLGDLSII